MIAARSHTTAALGRFVCLGADAARLAGLADALRDARVDVATCRQLEECLRLLATRAPGLCLVDLGARSGIALDTVRAIRKRHPVLTIVALTDRGPQSVADECRQAGATDVLSWPAAVGDLIGMLVNAAERSPAAPASDDGDVSDETLISQSPAMQHVVELVAEAARSRAGVCVSGEPGSGRGLVSRRIHALSCGDTERPLVVEDCGDAPQEIERRLFGVISTAQQASPAAGPEQIGGSSALLRANGGTLLLQNIIDAPARVQSRLVRLLRDREAVVLNGRRTVVEIDVQTIATLDSGADAALAEGRLRRDLYKLLSQIRIDMPPLRRRREDISALARHFLRQHCETRGILLKSLSRSALQVMTALPWRGNVTELRAMLDSLTASVDGPIVHLEHVLADVSLEGLGEPVDTGGTLRDARARFERDCISAVLIRHRGRVPEAAKALGIQRTNLYRKIRQLNVARSLLSARR